MAKGKNIGPPKSKYFKKQARKKVNKRIKKFSADGKITKRETKRIAKASAGYLKTGRLKRMIRRNENVQTHNKLRQRLKKFNVPNLALPLPGGIDRTPGGGPPKKPGLGPYYPKKPTPLPIGGEFPSLDEARNTPKPPGLGPTYEDPEPPTLRDEIGEIQDTYTDEMALADDPRNRRYVLGIRTKRGDRNRQGARGTFGRKGKRIKGLTNTSINL